MTGLQTDEIQRYKLIEKYNSIANQIYAIFKIMPFGEYFQRLLCHGWRLVNNNYMVLDGGSGPWGGASDLLFQCLFYISFLEQVLMCSISTCVYSL